MNRLFIGVGIYLLYLFGIIALLMLTNNVLLFLVLLFAGVGALLWATSSGFLTTGGNYKRLIEYGEDAQATVLAMKDTGITINKDPYVSVRLRVQPAGQPAYETNMRVAVSRLAIPRVGDTVQVKFDPKKPKDLIVV